jgi:hypothetical protein
LTGSGRVYLLSIVPFAIMNLRFPPSACFVLAALLSPCSGFTQTAGEPPFAVPNHTHERPVASDEAKTAASFYLPSPPREDAAVTVDWKFLDRTEVTVSDGVKDADIRYPAEIKALDGKRVRIIGFMAPLEKLTDLSEFMLIPFEIGCTFCNPPPVTQVILVKQKTRPNREKPPFAPKSITVTGTLRLFTFDSPHPAHQADFMYALDDATLELSPGKSGKGLPTPSIVKRKP